MERFCFVMTIKEGGAEEYKRRHEEIWPELSDAIREAGITNYGLFRRGRQIIGYCECEPDAKTAFERIEGTDVDRRWSEFMDDLMDEVVGPDGELLAAGEVWHQD